MTQKKKEKEKENITEWKEAQKISIIYLSQEIYSFDEREERERLAIAITILLLLSYWYQYFMDEVYDQLKQCEWKYIVGHFYLSRCNVTLEMISRCFT